VVEVNVVDVVDGSVVVSNVCMVAVVAVLDVLANEVVVDVVL
jgi:hypothetical protein